MKRARTVAPVLLAGPIVVMTCLGCPAPAGDDGGSGDAGASDAAARDSGNAGEAGFDSGCSDPCGSGSGSPITVEGVCQGSVLRYCDNDCVVERDCSGQPGGPYSCGPYGRFNECLADEGQACEPDYWNCDPSSTCTGNYPCDESADLDCSGGSDPVCVTSGTDAGVSDAQIDDATTTSDAQVDDAAVAPDSAATPDAAVEDSATLDDANAASDASPASDAAPAEDATPAEDAAPAVDATPTEDAATGGDAAVEDAAVEDSAALDTN